MQRYFFVGYTSMKSCRTKSLKVKCRDTTQHQKTKSLYMFGSWCPKLQLAALLSNGATKASHEDFQKMRLCYLAIWHLAISASRDHVLLPDTCLRLGRTWKDSAKEGSGHCIWPVKGVRLQKGAPRGNGPILKRI